eukprot:4747535-Pyramimonas_sp.AAC.1
MARIKQAPTWIANLLALAARPELLGHSGGMAPAGKRAARGKRIIGTTPSPRALSAMRWGMAQWA